MRIANIMFSRGKGGIEQAFIDYAETLVAAGHEVCSLTRPEAAVNTALASLPITRRTIKSYGPFDLYATYALRRTLLSLRPDVIIAHGNRALSMSKHASRRSFPIVGVTHNYSIARLHNTDAVFATTGDLASKVASLGVDPARIFRIPNMVRLPSQARTRTPATPLHIGAMGRFVHKKGFHIFIEALQQLKQRKVAFTATLAGTGEEELALRQQAAEAGLNDLLSFPGWVEDKAAFFNGIDLFCLPSLHEPFGIVLLEAMAHGVPVITTDSEGPSDIVTHGIHAVIVPKNDAAALAETLAGALRQPQELNTLATAGLALIREHYDIAAVGKQMDAALRRIAQAKQHLTSA